MRQETELCWKKGVVGNQPLNEAQLAKQRKHGDKGEGRVLQSNCG